MILSICISIILLVYIIIYLIIDYSKLRIIKFRQLDRKVWQIAFTEEEMWNKLDGNTAEIVMPEKPLVIRLYRYIFPLKFKEINI